MKLQELSSAVNQQLVEGLLSKVLKNTAAELQAAMDKKGANLAKVEIVTSPEGNDHIRVKMNSKGGSLTRAAVRRVIDDYMLPRFEDGNLLGIHYSLSMAASNLYIIRLS